MNDAVGLLASAIGLILVLLMVFRPQGLLGSLRVKLEMKPQSKAEADHERQVWSDAGN